MNSLSHPEAMVKRLLSALFLLTIPLLSSGKPADSRKERAKAEALTLELLSGVDLQAMGLKKCERNIFGAGISLCKLSEPKRAQNNFLLNLAPARQDFCADQDIKKFKLGGKKMCCRTWRKIGGINFCYDEEGEGDTAGSVLQQQYSFVFRKRVFTLSAFLRYPKTFPMDEPSGGSLEGPREGAEDNEKASFERDLCAAIENEQMQKEALSERDFVGGAKRKLLEILPVDGQRRRADPSAGNLQGLLKGVDLESFGYLPAPGSSPDRVRFKNSKSDTSLEFGSGPLDDESPFVTCEQGREVIHGVSYCVTELGEPIEGRFVDSRTYSVTTDGGVFSMTARFPYHLDPKCGEAPGSAQKLLKGRVEIYTSMRAILEQVHFEKPILHRRMAGKIGSARLERIDLVVSGEKVFGSWVYTRNPNFLTLKGEVKTDGRYEIGEYDGETLKGTLTGKGIGADLLTGSFVKPGKKKALAYEFRDMQSEARLAKVYSDP